MPLIRKLFLPVALLLPFVKGFASDLKDSVSVGMSTYTGTGDVQVYSPAFSLFKTLTQEFMLGVKLRLDAISAASIRNGGSPTATDAVTGASEKEGFDDRRLATTVMGVYTDGTDTLSGGLYHSAEVDYTGRSFFLNYGRNFNEENTVAGLGISQSDDVWDPAFARELPRDDRKERKIDLSVMQLISPKWSMQLVYSSMYSEGFLASPYHFVSQESFARFENYPETRDGYAVALKSVSLLNEANSMNLSYRYYRDDWEIASNTFGAEWLHDVSETLLLGARARYYTQSKASFTKPVGGYSVDDRYFAADYRMSAFDSYMVGVPLIHRFELPVYGEVKLSASVDYYWTSSNDYIKNWYGEDNLEAFSTTVMFDYEY